MAEKNSAVRFHIVSDDPRLLAMAGDLASAGIAIADDLLHLTSSSEAADTKYILDSASPEISPSTLMGYLPGSCLLILSTKELPQFASVCFARSIRILLRPVSVARLSLAVWELMKDADATVPENALQILLEYHEQATAVSKSREQFISRAVHDWRVPLTSMEGYLGLMLNRQLGEINDFQVRILRKMQTSVRRLNAMADGLLQLSSVRRPARKTPAPFEDVTRCLQSALSEMATAFSEKQIAVKLDISQPAPQVYVERNEMEHVFISLLENACFVTPRGGTVVIRAYELASDDNVESSFVANGDHLSDPHVFRIEIQDQGPELDREQMIAIFEEDSPAWRTGGRGHGLTLAVCRAIVLKHRGRIAARSARQVNTFYVALPCTSSTNRPTDLHEQYCYES